MNLYERTEADGVRDLQQTAPDPPDWRALLRAYLKDSNEKF